MTPLRPDLIGPPLEMFKDPLFALLGRDTRLSGPMLESALASGLASTGAHAVLRPVVPAQLLVDRP